MSQCRLRAAVVHFGHVHTSYLVINSASISSVLTMCDGGIRGDIKENPRILGLEGTQCHPCNLAHGEEGETYVPRKMTPGLPTPRNCSSSDNSSVQKGLSHKEMSETSKGL